MANAASGYGKLSVTSKHWQAVRGYQLFSKIHETETDLADRKTTSSGWKLNIVSTFGFANSVRNSTSSNNVTALYIINLEEHEAPKRGQIYTLQSKSIDFIIIQMEYTI